MNSTGEPRTASDSRGTSAGNWLIWLCLALAWFAATKAIALYEPDEGRYAEIPREMAASGDWLTPRLDDLKYFEKPPLQYWATAALYKAFGVSEITARAWPAGLSFLCLLLTWAWVRRHFTADTALAALVILGTSPVFLIIGHLNVLDGSFTFWLTAMLFSFINAQSAPQGSSYERNWMLLCWLSGALAILTKGIAAPVLAGLTLISYCLVQRDWRTFRRLHPLAGLPLFVAVAAPWFIAMSRENPEFAKFFFLHEHFERFLTTVHRRGEPFWYFLPIVLLAFLPWIGELPGALRRAWRAPLPQGRFASERFLLIFCAVVLVFFSISQSKLPPYIMPLIPALAAVLGAQLENWRSAVRRAAWISAALIALVAIGLMVYMRSRPDVPALLAPVWGGIAIALAVGSALSVRSARPPLHTALPVLIAAMLGWQCLMATHSVARSARELLAQVRSHIQADTTLYSVEQYRQSVPPYLARTLVLVDFIGELEFGLQQEPTRNSLSLPAFFGRWRAERNAVAFIEPKVWAQLQREHLPGRVIGRDHYSVVVQRQ